MFTSVNSKLIIIYLFLGANLVLQLVPRKDHLAEASLQPDRKPDLMLDRGAAHDPDPDLGNIPDLNPSPNPSRGQDRDPAAQLDPGLVHGEARLPQGTDQGLGKDLPLRDLEVDPEPLPSLNLGQGQDLRLGLGRDLDPGRGPGHLPLKQDPMRAGGRDPSPGVGQKSRGAGRGQEVDQIRLVLFYFTIFS